MKRIATLVMAAAFVLGTVCSASAVDFKVKGVWDFAFGWGDNLQFRDHDRDKKRNNDPFRALMRVRPQIDIIASESLSGTLMFEIGDINFGRGGTSGQGAGGALDTDGVNIETKRAYLDWIVPSTDLSIRMGLQGLALPSGTGMNNPVFNDDAAGVVASYKFNSTVSLTALWVRAFDMYENDSKATKEIWGDNLHDETDVFGMILPVSLDGVKITPWATYAQIGGTSGFWDYRLNDQKAPRPGEHTFAGDTEGWHTGVALQVSLLDPLTFGFDAIYGDVHGNAGSYGENPGARGWFLDANMNYKLDWGTPGLFGWWASGDSANDIHDGKFGRMPIISADTGFAPTDFGFDTKNGVITSRKIISASGVGTWGVGAQIKDLSFIENLTHTIRVAYYRGTNDNKILKDATSNLGFMKETVYLTDKDDAIEVNFNHKYQIYENLAAFLELGYIHLNLDDAWKKSYRSYSDTEDAWKAQIAFQYRF